MAANAIGPQVFIRVDGSLESPQQNFDIEVRAGVDGQAVYQTGKRSEPIRLVTAVDVANQGQAEVFYEQYMKLVGTIQTIWQAAVTPFNTRYLILHVTKLRIQNHLFAVGGLRNGATSLTCAWDVLPVENVGL